MIYKQNMHILLPIDEYEELRILSFKLKKPRSELAREAIHILLKKHRKIGNISEVPIIV